MNELSSELYSFTKTEHRITSAYHLQVLIEMLESVNVIELSFFSY